MTKKTKSTKALTPATKSTKSATKPAKKPAAKSAVKKTEPKAIVTTISAQIDVGFGNVLFIRGEGPGLSWEKGVPLNCVASNHWTIAVAESARPVVFKFLLNDETWCAGDDLTVEPGATVAYTPEF